MELRVDICSFFNKNNVTGALVEIKNSDLLNGDLIHENDEEKKSLSIDGLSASWFLFSFSRKDKKSEAKETFKTILPDGSLQIVNVEVKSHYKGKNGKCVLPGAFQQDILLSMGDLLVNKNMNELPEIKDIKRRKGQFLPVLTKEIPSDYKTLYFRNKDIAENIGMTSKNTRITDALRHLKSTSIRITGTIYKDGNVQKIEHDSYYLTSISVGKHLRGGMSVSDYNRATFDDLLIKQILGGYISKVDKQKLLSLKSGVPRKLYTLLATKKMSSNEASKRVAVTESELLSALQLTKDTVKKLFKKYVNQLIEAKILMSFQTEEQIDGRIYIFEFTNDEILLQGKDDYQVEEFFEALKYMSKADIKIRDAINSDSFDVTPDDLKQMISDFKMYSTEKVKKSRMEININKLVLWCDQLLWNIICGQKDMTVKGILTNAAQFKKAPSIRASRKFIPILIRYRNITNRQIAEEDERERKKSAKNIKNKIVSETDIIFNNFSDHKLKTADMLYTKFMQNIKLGVYPKPVYIKGLISHSIKEGLDLDDLEAIHESYVKSLEKEEVKKPEIIEMKKTHLEETTEVEQSREDFQNELFGLNN